MAVPQTGHLPFMAALPFFMVTRWALGSSRLARHLTQYIDATYAHPLSKYSLAIISKIKARIVTPIDLVKSDRK